MFARSRNLAAGIVLGILAGASTAAVSTTPATAPIRAQQLVDRTISAHGDLLDVIFHVTPPGSTQNMAIAAFTDKERGVASGEDDIGVMNSGKPLVEVQKDGVRIGVLVPLKERSGRIVGALGLMYAYHTGQKEDDFLRRSEIIRDGLQRDIVSREALFEHP